MCYKRDRSKTVALVECDEREEVIHIDLHKYPPSAAISSRISHTHFSTIFNNFQTLLAAFSIEYVY